MAVAMAVSMRAATEAEDRANNAEDLRGDALSDANIWMFLKYVY